MNRWDALYSFKEWKGDRDDVVVYAIRGPHDAGVGILVRNPYELYENDEVFVREIVAAAELAGNLRACSCDRLSAAVDSTVWHSTYRVPRLIDRW